MSNPKQLAHELAMLYLHNQDLSGKTPAEICKLYADALDQFARALAKDQPSWF